MVGDVKEDHSRGSWTDEDDDADAKEAEEFFKCLFQPEAMQDSIEEEMQRHKTLLGVEVYHSTSHCSWSASEWQEWSQNTEASSSAAGSKDAVTRSDGSGEDF